MRDFRKGEINHDKLLERAEKKMADQKVLLRAMKPGDPSRLEAERLLNQIQQNLDLVRTNRAFSHYNEEGD